MNRAEKAEEYFLKGYACSQAVFLAFADLAHIDEETASKISLPLGGGVGRMRSICGALTGMALAIGGIFAEADGDAENKLQVYAIVQELLGKFKEEYGTLICKELLEGKVKVEVGGNPENRTETYYQKRPCSKLVYRAAEILENYLIERGII